MSSRRYNQTRVKIDSPDIKMIEEILDILEEKFMCLPGPIKESTSGGHHVFVNLRRLQIE